MYASRTARIAKAAKFLKHGTEVGIGLNVASTALEIKEACYMGREELCRQAHYLEGSKLAGGVLLGLAGGELGAYAAPVVCFAEFSAPTLRLAALGCGIIAGGALAYGSGALGEIVDESFGEVVYKWLP